MKKGCVTFWDLAEVEPGRWLVSAALFNSLCEIEEETGAVRPLSFFPHAHSTWKNSHRRVLQWNGLLYFFPRSARYREIGIYDRGTGELRSVLFPEQLITREDCLFEYELIDGTVWIVSRKSSCPILGFQLETESFTVKSQWNRRVEEYCKRRNSYFIFGSESRGSNLFLPLRDAPSVMEINTGTDAVSFHPIGAGEEGLELIVGGDRDTFYLTLRGCRDVLLWDPAQGRTLRYKKEESEAEGEKRMPKNRSYHQMFRADGRVFLIPADGSRLCYLDDRNKRVVPFGDPLRERFPQLKNTWFGEAYVRSREVIVCPGDAGMMLSWNLDSLEATGRSYHLKGEDLERPELKRRIRGDLQRGPEIVEENAEIFWLDDLLDILTEDSGAWEENPPPRGELCGGRIYEAMKGRWSAIVHNPPKSR